MASLVVWDLKTVSDANDSDDRQIDDAFSSITRSIICIGRLIAHFDVYRWRIDSVYAWHVAAQSERDIIKQFFDLMADIKPQLVSWNAFPILEYRAMRHKLAMPQFSAELHNKYAPESIALCDVFSPAQRRIGLREFCAVLGLGYDVLDKVDIERYFREKRMREIAEYCEREVINIFKIWLRRELYNGNLSSHGFQRSEDLLLDSPVR
jgi:predicted PolB exonuclease-like 3'-5' exonuclease